MGTNIFLSLSLILEYTQYLQMFNNMLLVVTEIFNYGYLFLQRILHI